MTSRLRRLECRQLLPLNLAEAWEFFSRPDNLARITPADLGFEVTSPLPERMYAGMIVSYRVSPFGGFRVPWVTEITHVREPNFFVDEQRGGPYRFWHHQHHFRVVAGGVEMTDLVHFQLPFGILGDLLAGALVERRVAAIFAYRRRVLAELFGQAGGVISAKTAAE
jgi:ligand-binding SRPBCC domain-containing protein